MSARARTILAAAALAALLAPAVVRAVPPGPGAVAAPGAAIKNSCADCHRMQDEARLSAPVRAFAQDIHALRGLGCVACHGGDPRDDDVTAMDPDKGFRGKPARAKIAELCASCHADAEFMKRYNPRPYIFSMAEFRTSVHCKKAIEGDLKVATCTNCHGVHGILPPNDPRSPVYKKNVPFTCGKCHNAEYMKGRTVPTNQLALWKKSVHGRALLEKGDLSAPACNDCHGNHGAVPPNTRDISFVCGNCHGREGELFAKSPVKEGLELEGKRACVTCHSNHDVEPPTDAMVSAEPNGLCGRCHGGDTAGARATAVIVPGFHGLRAGIARADSLLDRADLLGMETASGRDLLKQANDQLVSVRAALHSFDTKQITAVLTEGTGLAERASGQARTALRDWRNRRIGMALSLVVILVLITLLVLKIRQVERS